MTLMQRSATDLLEAFAAATPTPGGGSAAALAGALGASLLRMVAGMPRTRTGAEAERAALNWAEVLTRLPGGEVSEAAYAQACAHFSVAQVAELALAVAEINAWNRLMMAARTSPMSAIKTSAASAA